jgi:hypothetical protein
MVNCSGEWLLPLKPLILSLWANRWLKFKAVIEANWGFFNTSFVNPRIFEMYIFISDDAVPE